MIPASTTSVRLDVVLRPEELVAAWRADTGRLVLPAATPVKLQQRVISRITLAGRGAAGTLTGRAVSSSRAGDHHRIEVVPDEPRRPALQKLLAIARGEAVDYRPRSQRFLATLPAVVAAREGQSYRTTFSVSAGGCGLSWSGPVPEVGAPLQVRLGAGSRAATFQGVVCWTAQAGRAPTVGVRFLEGPRGAWASMLTEVERSGAPDA